MRKNDERASLTNAPGESDPPTDGRNAHASARIVGFHQDEEGHWVAELSCGHTQHMRHLPPWQSRPWTQDAEARAARIGEAFACGWCAQEVTADKEF
ncbi:DUF3565 domain-containing protein [Pseudomonas sp. UL073]|uniref:DUF3565 domain-containing protein n=1 Tax=Zestomonas insulae TaxID=2809017 RepID=A0ABS2IE18_9GAMM|nr:DUF3565 domain-containing protein [Pseudomonas insulae]MBM7060125.1 DUF3565 domain-containing protein [Pseudomonas insulae]